MIWTAELDQLLIKLWDDGGTLTSVSRRFRELGYNATRGAIAGRRHRLGAQAFNRPKGPPIAVRRKVVIPVSKPKPPKPEPPARRAEGVDYFENTGCKALLSKTGDYGLPLCCGKPRLDMGPYCAEHAALYGPPSAVKRERTPG